ncbi:hypothetical protein [Peribacillus butanolivorans]|uniref:hypothetical protein n=1 Tax=Peribacillus butanolivorans TaxID=421767 RepID=UPI001597041C|nr:hypothetical protein [Peribacillus butanolivorans]
MTAIERNELQVHYITQVHLETGDVIGLEYISAWRVHSFPKETGFVNLNQPVGYKMNL